MSPRKRTPVKQDALRRAAKHTDTKRLSSSPDQDEVSDFGVEAEGKETFKKFSTPKKGTPAVAAQKQLVEESSSTDSPLIVCKDLSVLVQNLHETTKESQVISLFSESGKVLKVNIRLNQRTGLKGGIVYFENKDSVNKALKLDQTEFLGQLISVKPNLDKTATSVYITNLHRGASEIDLCLIFQECGHIENVIIPKQKNTLLLREAAVIKFRDVESVAKALAVTKKNKVRGRRLVAHKDDPFLNRGKRGLSRAVKRREAAKQGRNGFGPQRTRKTSG